MDDATSTLGPRIRAERDGRASEAVLSTSRVAGMSSVSALALLGLYWAERYSFLLFHTLAELFSITVAAAAFSVAWNGRRHHSNLGLTTLGVSLLAVAAIELAHMLAYRGMGVFPDDGAGLSTQLWIASRYLFASSIIVVPLLLRIPQHRPPRADERPRRVVVGEYAMLVLYAAVVALLLLAIFYWKVFPVCFDPAPDGGLTPFKVVSEFVICGMMAVAGALLWWRRRHMDRDVMWLLLLAMALSIVSSFCFTQYSTVYSPWSWTGHVLKIVSAALIYQAIVVVGLREPLALIFRDMSAQQERLADAHAAAEQANAAKDRFLAVLSHELRNPLNPVLAEVSALQRRDDLPDDLRDGVAMIRRNVELEARLIDDLLDLTRIARGKMKLERAPVDLQALVRQAADICAADLEAKRLRLALNLGARRPVVEGDAVRLLQVIWNVLNNAVKFSRRGGHIEISIKVDPAVPPSGDVARLTIADDGAGIPADQVAHIFDAFKQIEKPGTQQQGGLGLGLAICRALVEAHNGTIHAESDGEERGSRFVIELPTIDVPIPAAAPAARFPGHLPADLPRASKPATAAADRPPRSRLLLVEDHGDTAKILARLLRSEGYQVRVAGTVGAGLSAAADAPFDLLVSDLGLPDGTGLDLMRELKGRYGLRGICMSGYGMEDDLHQSAAAGFERHLVKPVAFETLCEAVADALQPRHAAPAEASPVTA